MTPFQILNNICSSHTNILVTEADEKDYAAFFINKGLGMGIDTVLFANEMNKNAHLDKKMQYDYLRFSIPNSKRYNKWAKTKIDSNIQLLKDFYKTTWEKAKEIESVLTKDQIKGIQLKVESKKGK